MKGTTCVFEHGVVNTSVQMHTAGLQHGSTIKLLSNGMDHASVQMTKTEWPIIFVKIRAAKGSAGL